MNKLLKLFFLFLFLSVVLAQTDTDKDGIPDSEDNSPLHWNPFQEDVDGDGIGDWSDSTTIRVSLSESFSGHTVALSSKILAALKTIHSEDRVITEVQFVSVDDIDSHLVFNTTDLTLKARDTSLIDFDVKHLYDYNMSVSHQNTSGTDSLNDELQLRIYLEENREQSPTNRTSTIVKTGLTENLYLDPFSNPSSETQFGDINVMWRAPGFGENQAYYGDINGDGFTDMIFGDYRVNYFGRNFNIHHLSNPVYMINDGNLNFDARYNNFENKTIFHSPNMAVEADLDGDGIDEILNFGETYHTNYIFHPHWDYIKKWMASRDLVFNQDYNDESAKKLRYFTYDDSGIVDQYSKITPGNIPNSSDGSFFLSMYASGVGDIDGDGDNDIISTGQSSASNTGFWLMILENDGSGNFSSTYKEIKIWTAQGHLEVYDITGDGLNDILLGANTYLSDGKGDNNLALIKGNSSGDFDTDISDIVMLDMVHPHLAVRNVYVEDINGDGFKEIIAYYTGGYGENNAGIADDEIPNQVKIYEIVDESRGYVNDITSSFFINNEDQMNFYAQSAFLRLQDIDQDGYMDLVPSFTLEPFEDYPQNAYRGDWNDSKGFQFFKFYPHIGKFKVVDLGVFKSFSDRFPHYNAYDLEDLNGDGNLEFIHVSDGQGVFIYEYDFGNYCGDSGNGQATFEVNNLTDVNYLKNLSSVSITPYFGCSSFVPQKYMIALGDSAENLTNVLVWTEVSLSGSELLLSSLNLDDHQTYYISLKAQNASGVYNTTVTKSFTTYKNLLGDFDQDWDVDMVDLNSFVNGWPGVDIGPAVGTAPYLIPNLDTKSDIFDLNVFTRNWLWSADNRTLSRINSTPSSFEHQISFSVEDNRISIVVPGSITSGRIQLEHNAHQTKYELLNKAGNLLLLENNEDFYELSFGNLAKEDAIIIVEVSEGEVPQNLSYEIFNKTGAIESNSINFSTIASNFLYQNFPNPFHDSTTFQYDLATASNVKFIIYDIRGRIVNEINEGYKEPGQYSYVWNATNKDDRKVSSGVYFYQLYLDNYQSTKKMTFIYKKE